VLALCEFALVGSDCSNFSCLWF